MKLIGDRYNTFVTFREVMEAMGKLSDKGFKLWMYLNCEVVGSNEGVDIGVKIIAADLGWSCEEVTDTLMELGLTGYMYSSNDGIHVRACSYVPEWEL